MPRAGWLALGATGAALLATQGFLPPGLAAVLLAAAALIGTAALAATRRWRPFALAFGFATVLVRAVAPGVLVGPPPDPGPIPTDERAWIAEVVTTGAPREGIARGTLLLRPDAADARWTAPLPRVGWRVYAWLPRYPALVPGDVLPLTGAVQPPPDDGSGFAGYLASGGFAGTLRVGRVIEVSHGAGPISGLETQRRAAADLVARALPEPEGGLAAGILIGIRERVGKEVSDAFATTGLSHVVAISGWNIALVGSVVGALLAATGLGRRDRSLLVVVAIALYTLLSGASASVVRAALMGGVAIAARASGRPGTASTALGVAVWVLVLAEPTMAADIGFQLSVTATAGLLAWGDRITTRLLGVRGDRCPRWLAETLGVSLAAQLATLPLVLFHFGRLSLISPLANLLVAPLVAPAMVVSLLGLLGGAAVSVGLPTLMVAPIALAGRLVLGGMIAIANVLAGVPLASLTLPAPLDLAGAAVGSLLVGWAWRCRTRPAAPGSGSGSGGGMAGAARPDEAGARPTRHDGAGSRRVAGPPAGHVRGSTGPALVVGVGVAALVLVSAVAIAGHPEPRLTVTVLDVGQGDAILIEGPRGSRMLVDGGPDPDRLIAVLDARLPPWDRRLDLVVLSHPHEDHVAGLALLLERYRVGRIAENGMLGAGPGDAAFRERLVSDGRLTARLAAGDRLRLDEADAIAWWPRRGEVPVRSPDDGRAINDTSVVLDLRFGSRRILLMGDVEDDIDPQLLAAGIADGGRVDLLKVAHHGSRTASTEAFLVALHPRVAVASAGTGNRYGHPAPSTLDRLAGVGARVLRTDTDGSVTVSTDGRDLRVSMTGGRAPAAARTLVIPDPGVSLAVLPGPCRIPRRVAAGSAGIDATIPGTRSTGVPPPAPDAATPATTTLGWVGPTGRSSRVETGVASDPATLGRGPWSAAGRGAALDAAVAHPPMATSPAVDSVASRIPCYDRPRDDPHPVRRGRHPARPRRVPEPGPPHDRGGRDRRVPRGACGGSRRPREPVAGGGRRAPP